jgi:hypothetical protein
MPRCPAVALVVLELLMTVVPIACSDGPSGPEEESPMIDIRFPTSGDYDRDGDGLVDIEVRFVDFGSGIDPATVQIRSSRALGPLGQRGTDLLEGFQVIQRDDSLAVLEETTDALLPDGPIDLIVHVSDQVGNPAERRIAINLPSGQFHRYLSAGPQGIDFERFGIEMLPDGSKGYLLGQHGHDILPFDPFALTFGNTIVVPGFVRFLPDGVYDPATARLYLIDTVQAEILVLDPVSDQFEAPISTSARGVTLELGPSGLIYASLSARRASVAVVDPAERNQIKLIELPYESSLNEAAFIGASRVPTEEDRLHVILHVGPAGLGVFDMDGAEIDWIDLNPGDPHPGFGNQSAIDRMAEKLYVTDTPTPGGLVEVDLSSQEVVRELRMDGLEGRNLALSPSTTRALVTLGAQPGFEPENWLVDLTTMTILEHLPSVMNLDRPGDQKGVFRPDGQLFFIVSGNGISVYLNRE